VSDRHFNDIVIFRFNNVRFSRTSQIVTMNGLEGYYNVVRENTLFMIGIHHYLMVKTQWFIVKNDTSLTYPRFEKMMESQLQLSLSNFNLHPKTTEPIDEPSKT
jgi:hypothetical protein